MKGGKGGGGARGDKGDVGIVIGKRRPSRCEAQNLQMFFLMMEGTQHVFILYLILFVTRYT